MERRNKIRRAHSVSLDRHEETEANLRKSIEEKTERIKALEDEIRSLRDMISSLHLDRRFWIGFPIGLSDEPCGGPKKEFSNKD